jgi:hypothetical protein
MQYHNELGLDITLLETSWTTTKELQLLPGGIWQQRRDYDERDMSKSSTLASFLSRGLARWVLCIDCGACFKCISSVAGPLTCPA